MSQNNHIFPIISPELKFVLSCTDETINISENKELLSLLNWSTVLKLSLIHGLFPYVYNTLKKLDNQQIPNEVLNLLKQRYIFNSLKIIGLADEIVRIVKYLKKFGIEPVILKGPPLSVRINEDITLRPSNDIDILVDPLDFAKAERCLENLGYDRVSPDFQLTSSQYNFYLKNQHHFEYYNSKRASQVELHWRLRSYNTKNFSTTNNIKTQKIFISDYNVSVLADEYWLLYLMVHGYKHMWTRLRWLFDIKGFIKLGIDWDKLILLAKNFDLESVLNQTLILLNNLLNFPIPEQLESSVSSDKKAWQLTSKVIDRLFEIENNESPQISELSLLDKISYFNYNSEWSNKLKYISDLFKPREGDFKLISLPDLIFPLYYFIVPILRLWGRISFILNYFFVRL